ncbi:PP2C family protein-serine/threonine phosphatase [Plantactinospora sp. CA-290183]|uniref:PP2C family protein-serine/threonine phosphatase n=1 Tax=Plantactinospora sp. CA-290183 TaxID=3240006 RepID=UPI003D93110E
MLFRVPMQLLPPGPRPLSPGSRAGLGAAFVLLALVAVTELASRPEADRPPGEPPVDYVGLILVAPFLAAAFASWRVVVAVGVVAMALSVSLAATGHLVSEVASVNAVGVVLATTVAALVARIRQRQVERIAELTKLASVAQQAVLRPLGPQVGSLAVAGHYISSTASAEIGGDLYEAIDTPYGVRMIIGDVRGKGLDAVRLASIVLGSYRHVAYERADLRAIVADLDRAVARNVGDEDFVTAALVEERGGTLTIVNCGHPAPLLLRRGQVIPLEPPAPAPPLGFMPVVRPRVERLEPGDRLLLFTDGLGEARRDGEFFPTADRAWRLLGHGTVADGLVSLEAALVEWVHGRLDDDIALVLMEYLGPRPVRTTVVPSWEVGASDG